MTAQVLAREPADRPARRRSRRANATVERLEDRQLLTGGTLVFAPGDVFIGVPQAIQWRHADGTLVTTLPTAAATNTGMAFNPQGQLFATAFTDNQVNRFDTTGASLGAFGSGYGASPESIVFDATGNSYVGQADGTHSVLKFDPSGNLVDSYPVQIESRGSDWIELAADQHTLYYTSEGHTIKRYDLATRQQLPDFATGLPGDEAFQLRFLTDGSLLLADDHWILRIGTDGKTLQTYGYDPGNQWFNLSLDPDGTSFWSTDQGNGRVARFDITSGQMLSSFIANPGGATGLAVYGEDRAATAAAIGLTVLNAPANAALGGAVSLTFQVTNQGPAAALGTIIAVTLPAGAAFVSGSSSTGASLTPQGNSITFALGSLPAGASATVSVIVQANATGPMAFTASVTSSTPNRTPAASTLSQTIQVNPPLIPAPIIISLRRDRVHRQPTRLVLTFSQDMDRSRVQNVRNYAVAGPLGQKRITSRKIPWIPIRRAVYNPTTRTVTLWPARLLDLRWIYQLTAAAGPSGLTSMAGVPIAGNGSGSNYTAYFQGFGQIG